MQRNVIFFGLWSGYGGKPVWTDYIAPVIDRVERMRLFEKRVRVSMCVADLPAKASILNMAQYNGYHGCSLCLHPGERDAVVPVMLYPPAPDVQPRDAADSGRLAQDAVETGIQQFGARGPSV